MFLHFDPALARVVWNTANMPGLTNQTKRDLLEVLIAYLLATQADFQIVRNLRTLDAQIDLLIRNLTVGNPVLQEFGTYLLAECKNWHRAVSARVAKSFISNLRSALS